MPDWPADGVTNWNQKMKANIDVGHDSDGTHKKSQMLTDMEWSPTAFAGESSATLPNGLIFKWGSESVTANATDTITYSDTSAAFPNATLNVTLGPQGTNVGLTGIGQVSALTAASFDLTNAPQVTVVYYWFAIGY